MTDGLKTPKPGALIEMPEGWDVLYAADGQRPGLTDERILAIAERHRNHTLTAQSGTRFDVIEHKDLIAFAREIEHRVIMQQAMADYEWTPERHAQADIESGKPGDVHAQKFEAIIRAEFAGDHAAHLPPFRWMQAYNAEMKRQGFEYGSLISADTCDTEIVFMKIMTDAEKSAAWASIEERMSKAGRG